VLQVASASPDVRARYTDYYAGPSAWRAIGARDKASSVERLCRAIPHATLLEVGCGDGALLADLAERRFARSSIGVDVSRSAVDAARARGIPSTGLLLFGGYALPFPDRHFDLRPHASLQLAVPQ